MSPFGAAREGLSAALAANTAGSGVGHVVIAFPSYSVGESLLAHYGDRLLALEHRYLLSSLMTHRLPDVEAVYVSSVAPAREVLDYYRALGPCPTGFDERVHVVSLEDRSPRCVAEKLVERPDLVERIRRIIGDRPAVLEPWHVTEHEVRVAERLQVPINGMLPDLRHVGFKGAGRRLFREAGVPVPDGTEGVRSVDDVLDAVSALQDAHPTLARVVVKHDDSGAGDGNAVLDARDASGAPLDRRRVRGQVEKLPAWYLSDLGRGGVVEEFLTGTELRSPSAQVDLLPDGRTQVIATHEQVLGGENGQVFLGCRFPAAPDYAAELARHADAIAGRLVTLGVIGRISVDFVAVRDGSGPWRLYALEVNLRKGGTTHPYTALRNLVPGTYDALAGTWLAADGRPRAYVCTDNCVDPAWFGVPARSVIDAVRGAGIEFDHRRGTGVILHMLGGLDVDGRFGIIAIGEDPDHADTLFERTREVVHRVTTTATPA
jgi:hypothetical protein